MSEEERDTEHEETVESETAAEPAEPAQAPPAPPGPTPEGQGRRLTRSRDDQVIAGVCGGLGEYFGIDPVLIRIAALVLVFAGGAGVVLYIIGWIAMPEPEATTAGEAAPREPRTEGTSGAALVGLVFVALGLLFLADEVWPDFLSWKYVWPVALIAVGAVILVRSRR